MRDVHSYMLTQHRWRARRARLEDVQVHTAVGILSALLAVDTPVLLVQALIFIALAWYEALTAPKAI